MLTLVADRCTYGEFRSLGHLTGAGPRTMAVLRISSPFPFRNYGYVFSCRRHDCPRKDGTPFPGGKTENSKRGVCST